MSPAETSNRAPSREMAEAVATQALCFPATDPERISLFLSLTWLRAAPAPGAREPRVPSLGLDFPSDEALAVAFAAESASTPKRWRVAAVPADSRRV